ncbi:oxidoreductase [Pseudotabrizicola alkalilacus]|uniref:Oxidoreductase n=1 Tax=Pseudotabrizicola alkalilacus TaxID=2305252 RepID=A0A411Z0H5_9RHOB|nr:oxidoreductase [Pseudotabrizicola alkalilacus]RGP36550.1 oxidoreductase [Pseudotabrizicola alkalilacus]
MDCLKRSTVLALASFSLLTVLPGGTTSARSDTPGAVLLTVHGPSGAQDLNLADLDSFDQHSFTTSTIWTTGLMEFSGPALTDVVASAGSGTGGLRLRAANDYSITLNPSMLEPRAPIIATRINGQTFTLRERGPLWLVFPYDAHARFRTEQIFAASIWQLTDIDAASAP